MSEVLKITDKTPEELEQQAKEKALEEGKEVVARVDTPEGLAFLQENANRDIQDPNYDPMSGAAATFGLFAHKLWPLVDKLSNKQLRRLLKALVTYPLENTDINRKNPIEVDAYRVAHQLLESKYLMIIVTAFEEQEKRREAADRYKAEQAAKTVSSETTDELTKQNGETNVGEESK